MRSLGLIPGVFLALLWMAPLAPPPLSAQEPTGTVRGRVTDNASQQPISGVTVAVGSRVALTQADGQYVITGVRAGTDSVRTRMIGYAPAASAVAIAGGETAVVDFALTGQAVSLSEIVVTGYGEQRAGNITGAVTQVTPAEFNTGRVISPEQLIQSKVAGVQVEDNNEPGGGLRLRIRGATSVNASSDPLYVIDGVPIASGAGGGLSAGRNPLNFLNPNDIESITVLKDASAAAIYGANAANGVVLIQTKSARRGVGPRIEYSGSTSASDVTRLPSMLNAAQFRAAVEQYAPGNVSQLDNTGLNTNWFDLVDRTAFGQEHNVSVSGAGETNQYRLSLGYLNQDGIIRGTNTDRLALGFNYSQRLYDDRLNIRTSLKGSRAFDEFTPGGVLSNAAQMGPTQPVFDPNTLTGYYDWPGNRLTSADNPVALLNLATDHGTTYRSVGSVQADYDTPFLRGLRTTVNLGYDVTKVDREIFNPRTLHAQLKTGDSGTVYHTTPSQVNTVLETYATYTPSAGILRGSIDVTGGYSYAQSRADDPRLTAKGLSTDALADNGIPAAKITQNTLTIDESRLISFFGRVNYNYGDRWLAAVSLRRDGSSRFGPSNQWGTFPAVSVGWRLSQEPFIQGLGGISDLKLRAAWGKTGNQAFGNYKQYSAYQPGDAQTLVQFGNQFVSTGRPGAVDPDIKWEQTSAWNVGLDFGFSNQRISGSLDWYVKNTSDLIFEVPVAAGTNLSNYLTTNIGSMRNRGIELALNAQVREAAAHRLSWTASFTASHNKNELVSINPVFGDSAGGARLQQILTGLVAGGVGTNIQVYRPGVPINSFFVYQHIRDANGKPIYADRQGLTNGRFNDTPDGTIDDQDLYVDLNNDNVINQDDRRPFHDPAPKWILGHSSYLAYGSFDLSFTVRAYLGSWVYNNVASNLGSYEEVTRGSPYNLHSSVLETNFRKPQYLSDYYVEDASFVRMDNVSLAYSFNYRGQPLRVFGALQNAFTITGYAGVDPTAGLNGLDNNIYPRSRTFTGGVSVRF